MIHASIRKNVAQSYHPQLNEGSIYTITNFLVEENKGNYHIVYNKFKILFNSTTSVSKFSGFDHSKPQFQFEFADYGTIASCCYDTTYLTGNFNCFTSQAYTFTKLENNAIHNLIPTLKKKKKCFYQMWLEYWTTLEPLRRSKQEGVQQRWETFNCC